jgi:hypothetical protein
LLNISRRIASILRNNQVSFDAGAFDYQPYALSLIQVKDYQKVYSKNIQSGHCLMEELSYLEPQEFYMLEICLTQMIFTTAVCSVTVHTAVNREGFCALFAQNPGR